VRWLHSLRDFLKEINAEIEIDHDQVPQIQRQYDDHIMDKVLTENAFTSKEINRINNCRLYLQAVTIADICTACGTIFDPFFLEGQTSLLSSTTNWVTTNQQQPGAQAWTTWRHALQIWSRPDGTLY
jgi:hypothetical protein